MFNLFSKRSVSPPKKSDHDRLMDEMFGSKSRKDQYKSIFKYDNVNQYKSIHTYEKPNRNEVTVDHYTRPGGLEILINYGIIGFFYFLLVILLPFSLFVCLKKVKENERMIIYRLGRIVPEQKAGYRICFPLIDSYKKISTAQKEFSVPNLQILTEENAILDTTTIVRYEIFDPVKLLNTLEDLNSTLKSVARGFLVGIVSKKDSSKVEKEKGYIIQEFTNEMNNHIKRWGLKITNVELNVNSIQQDPNEGEDPALKTISMVFKSLLGGGNSSGPSTSTGPKTDTSMENLPNDLMKFIESLSQPMVIPGGADMAGSPFAGMLGGMMPGMMPATNPVSTESVAIDMEADASTSATAGGKMSPFQILKLLEPIMTENLVKEIQCVYEFHISSTTNRGAVEIFYLDLKNLNKGKIGQGRAPFSEKTDCVIRLNEDDLHELLTENLKPFTAYMSGRIEIDGDLQDVMKLKKLISSVSSIIANMSMAANK